MKKKLEILNKIEDNTASILLIITSLLVFVQVILRKGFNYSISWSEEMSRMMIAWFIFIGSSMAVKEKAHVSMDVLAELLKGRVKIIIEIVVNIINIIFCIMIINAGIGMIKSAVEIGAMATSIRIPLYIPYASVPVGISLMLLRYMVILINRVKALLNFGKEVEQ